MRRAILITVAAAGRAARGTAADPVHTAPASHLAQTGPSVSDRLGLAAQLAAARLATAAARGQLRGVPGRLPLPRRHLVAARLPELCPTRSPQTGARFSFWHPDLVTLHLWLWYPNPAGLYHGTNPWIRPFNHG